MSDMTQGQRLKCIERLGCRCDILLAALLPLFSTPLYLPLCFPSLLPESWNPFLLFFALGFTLATADIVFFLKCRNERSKLIQEYEAAKVSNMGDYILSNNSCPDISVRVDI